MHRLLWLLFPCALWLSACGPEKIVEERKEQREGPAYSTVPSQLGLIHQMQGRWKDQEIKNAELLISGNRFVSIYKDEVRHRATFEVFEKKPKSCPGKRVPGAKGYFIVHREDGDFCYVLNTLENGVLEYLAIE